MSTLADLLNQIQIAIDLANQMSQDSTDNFAVCSSSLQTARVALSTEDRSAECLCPCHSSRKDWHALPCGCYTGNPWLG